MLSFSQDYQNSCIERIHSLSKGDETLHYLSSLKQGEKEKLGNVSRFLFENIEEETCFDLYFRKSSRKSATNVEKRLRKNANFIRKSNGGSCIKVEGKDRATAYGDRSNASRVDLFKSL